MKNKASSDVSFTSYLLHPRMYEFTAVRSLFYKQTKQNENDKSSGEFYK